MSLDMYVWLLVLYSILCILVTMLRYVMISYAMIGLSTYMCAFIGYTLILETPCVSIDSELFIVCNNKGTRKL